MAGGGDEISGVNELRAPQTKFIDVIESTPEGITECGVRMRYDNSADVGRVPDESGLEDVSSDLVQGSLAEHPVSLKHGFVKYVISGVDMNGAPATRTHRQYVTVMPGSLPLFSESQCAADLGWSGSELIRDGEGNPVKRVHRCSDGFA